MQALVLHRPILFTSWTRVMNSPLMTPDGCLWAHCNEWHVRPYISDALQLSWSGGKHWTGKWREEERKCWQSTHCRGCSALHSEYGHQKWAAVAVCTRVRANGEWWVMTTTLATTFSTLPINVNKKDHPVCTKYPSLSICLRFHLAKWLAVCCVTFCHPKTSCVTGDFFTFFAWPCWSVVKVAKLDSPSLPSSLPPLTVLWPSYG